MRPPFSIRSCSCRRLFTSTLASLFLLGTVAVSAASPGAAFQELPEAPVAAAFTLQVAASTVNVLSRITTIPEPASCLLFGTAAFGLLAIRKRLRPRS